MPGTSTRAGSWLFFSSVGSGRMQDGGRAGFQVGSTLRGRSPVAGIAGGACVVDRDGSDERPLQGRDVFWTLTRGFAPG
jgi:hypothetical protein